MQVILINFVLILIAAYIVTDGIRQIRKPKKEPYNWNALRFKQWALIEHHMSTCTTIPQLQTVGRWAMRCSEQWPKDDRSVEVMRAIRKSYEMWNKIILTRAAINVGMSRDLKDIGIKLDSEGNMYV